MKVDIYGDLEELEYVENIKEYIIDSVKQMIRSGNDFKTVFIGQYMKMDLWMMMTLG